MSWLKLSLAILAISGGFAYTQPELMGSLLVKFVFNINLIYFTHFSPSTIPEYTADARALDAIWQIAPLKIDENFPASMRMAAENFRVFNPVLADTKISPDRIPSSQPGKYLQVSWVDVRGVHSPVSLPHILYLHGGGYIFGSSKSYSGFVSKLVHAVHARALIPDYRLRPEATLDEILEDAVSAYQYLLSKNVHPSQIVIAGDSAGGNLAFMLTYTLKERGIALPAGVVLISPWGDISNSLKSHIDNDATDYMFDIPFVNALTQIVTEGNQELAARFSPSLFPVDAFRGLPKTFIIYSTTEILSDDSSNIVSKYREAGSQIVVISEPYLPHVYPLFSEYLNKAQDGLNAIISFIRLQTLARR